MRPAEGSDAPATTASTRLTAPAASPLIIAICTGSAALKRRVKLLSNPQARHAPAIARAPQPKPSGPPCQDSTTAPARIAVAPVSKRRSTCSPNRTQASAIVARLSRFNRRLALEAAVAARPSISRSGPMTPPLNTTRASGFPREREDSEPEPGSEIEKTCQHPRAHAVAEQQFGERRADAEQGCR